jgi:uncharacterized protein
MQQPIQLTIPSGALTIDAYGTDGFMLGEKRIADDLLIYKNQSLALHFDFNNLSADSFDVIWALSPKPDLLLFGTGATHQFIAPSIRQIFKSRQIPLETMDTGAACRTYNILLAESRQVAALLIKPHLPR